MKYKKTAIRKNGDSPHLMKNNNLGTIPIFRAIIISIAMVAAIFSSTSAYDETGKFLAKFAKDPEPWLHIEANSEQRQPLYIGSTPREIALRLVPEDGGRAVLYDVLRSRGETQMRQVRDALARSGAVPANSSVEFEMWPAYDDYGQLTWAFARWHPGPGQPWQRFEDSLLPPNPDPRERRYPILPASLDPAKKGDYSRIFDDVLTRSSLCDKPLFGECVWMANDGRIIEAWLGVEKREVFAEEVNKDIRKMGGSMACRIIPQPPRLNGRPITFIIALEADKVLWPSSIQWKEEKDTPDEMPKAEGPAVNWPADFAERLKDDVLVLSGEKNAAFPYSKRSGKFTKKNSAESDNQLQDLVAYLEERYKEAGISTWRQEFVYRGIKQVNLVAVIPGSVPSLRPVIMADHIDTAFCDDVFRKAGGARRVSSTGAGDNSAATATLVEAAPILDGLDLRRDIWLVHFTGEEFPADSLGARQFVSRLLKEKKDIEGAVILDKIASRGKDDSVFWVNAGDSQGSLKMAKIAVEAAAGLTDLKPKLQARFGEEGWLYNTDGAIFSDSGFPVISITGDLSDPKYAYRKGEHLSADNSAGLDWNYISSIARVAIKTVVTLADMPAAGGGVKAQPDWSIVIYMAGDDPELSMAYGERMKELVETAIGDNIEVLIERDAEWPDGSVRIVRTSSSHEEMEMPEQDSGSPAAARNFMSWARNRARGRNVLLVVQGRSLGRLGFLQDKTLSGTRGKSSMMTLRDFVSAANESGLRPDIAFFEASSLGSAEAVEELKDLSPYLVVSGRDVPYRGLPAGALYGIFEKPELSPRDLAAILPEEYAKEYAHDGSMVVAEKGYRIVAIVSIDTARWREFTGTFKDLASALKSSGFSSKLGSNPGWAASFMDRESSADIVELLNRLPLVIDDARVKDKAQRLVDDIGYPERASSEGAATITIDPARTRSFELRVEAYPFLTQVEVLGSMRLAWEESNQDLGLPKGMTYGVEDSRKETERVREFVVRCPEAVLKKPVVLRPWLAGAKVVTLITVDHEGRILEKKYFRDRDYVSVTEFPDTSFMVGEAHSQGAPFAHGVDILLTPPAHEADSYAGLAWNTKTGWGDVIFPAQPTTEVR